MGDRYISDVICAYCKGVNEGVMFADDWGEEMRCKICGKTNGLTLSIEITAHKPEDSS